MSTIPTGSRTTVALVAGLLLAGLAGTGVAQPLDRDLDAYCAFALRRIALKDLTLNSACNVGVDCPRPTDNDRCGVAAFRDVFFADGSQLAADVVNFSQDGSSIFQLFRNAGSSLTGVTIRQPGPTPDGANPFTLPILPDLDGDGTPSCRIESEGCVTDAGDLAVACGMPDPFPPCHPATEVRVGKTGDCTGVADAAPGNDRCDLAPGAYGTLRVANGGRLTLTGGDYAFCDVVIGKNTTTIAAAPSVLAVSGDVRVNNGSLLGQQCGDLTVFAAGPGAVDLGRNATVVAEICAPERVLGIGNHTDVTGRFAADTVTSDFNVRLGGCPGGVAGAGLCGCFDAFRPAVATVGDVVEFEGGCDLRTITGVTICDLPAPVVVQTEDELAVTVPAGATGACPVRGISAAGVFTADDLLLVS